MRQMPERWDELQSAVPLKLKPVTPQEAAAARAECGKRGIPVEPDAPVGVNEAQLFYAVLGVQGVVRLSR